MLPTYMKDVWEYSRHPGDTLLNKTHPFIGLVADLIQNHDYYGVEIRDEDANAVKQAVQAGAYVAKAFQPFWHRGYQKATERGAGPMEKALPLIGIMPAPKAMNQTPAERLASEIMRGRIPNAPISEVQAEKRVARSLAVSALRRGDSSVLQKELAAGKIRPADVRAIQSKATTPPLVSQLKAMPLDEAERIYRMASPAEKLQLESLMATKRTNAQKRGVAPYAAGRVKFPGFSN